MISEKKAAELIDQYLSTYFAATAEEASKEQMYKATVLVLRDLLIKKKQQNNLEIQKRGLKRVYYLCMEFLLGRSLKNTLYNLDLTDSFRAALQAKGFVLDELYELERDPGLGNGGLGRLAACFMDSLATLNYPAMGFSIRYEYGLFRQKLVENTQVELPDIWLDSGEVWMLPRSDKNFKVMLGGTVEESYADGKLCFRQNAAETVEATPYDIMIAGKDSAGVAVLRLWRASASRQFDMEVFARGDFLTATRADNEAELLSKVLYPADDHAEGKTLRLSQQYFLVSASLQSILKDHLKWYGTLDNLAAKAAIHINDTHPALAIPELMRLLMDEHGFGWDEAWDITVKTMAYTNHTVLSEALESWDNDLFMNRLPRIYMIVKEIDRRFVSSMRLKGKNDEFLSRTAVLWDRRVKMANLCVIGSHAVNGVSELHSNIIKSSIFKGFNEIWPQRFFNVTNGIAHRRWLCQADPALSDLIKELIGDGFVKEPKRLCELKKYRDDKTVLKQLGAVKAANKRDFALWLKREAGVTIDPASRFDVQVKRLHEYKRQLMNALKIIGKYLRLLDDPAADVTPETFIFGAKAAGSYTHAKRVISLLSCISAEINKTPRLREKLNVVFIENYNVTRAEHIIPAAEVSEQISLAGKEASGTSNMKFMLTGALTLGTVDGANVEILERVGNDNMFVFGMTAAEAAEAWRGYNATQFYSSSQEIRRSIDRLRSGFNGESFADLAAYLTIGAGGMADPYMCLADYASYIEACNRMDAVYRDPLRWNEMSLDNIAAAGAFAADRSIGEYARKIWGVKPLV